MTIKKEDVRDLAPNFYSKRLNLLGFVLIFLLKNEKRVLLFQKNRAARGSKLNKCDDKILLFARSEYRIKFRL